MRSLNTLTRETTALHTKAVFDINKQSHEELAVKCMNKLVTEYRLDIDRSVMTPVEHKAQFELMIDSFSSDKDEDGNVIPNAHGNSQQRNVMAAVTTVLRAINWPTQKGNRYEYFYQTMARTVNDLIKDSTSQVSKDFGTVRLDVDREKERELLTEERSGRSGQILRMLLR